MSEVGALIVKLRAETAEFKSDMGKVQADLDALKGKAGETGEAMDHSFAESRGGLMLVEESVGVRLPRHLNSLIAKIPAVGQAFAMMLPIAGVAVAIEIVAKLIEKHKELEAATAKAWNTLSDDSQSSLHKLDEKLLESGAKLDDLNGNHVAALIKRLHLINDVSFDGLFEQFKKLGKDADAVFATMQVGWVKSFLGMGQGAEGVVKHFDELEAKIQEAAKTGDNGAITRHLAEGIKFAIQEQDKLRGETSSYAKERSAALAQELSILIQQTQEQEKYNQEAKNSAAIATKDSAKNTAADTDEFVRQQQEKEKAERHFAAEVKKAYEDMKLEHQKLDEEDAKETEKALAENAKRVLDNAKHLAEQAKSIQNTELEETIRMSHLKAEAEIEEAQHAQKMKFAGGGDNATTVQAELAASQAMYQADLDGYNARIAALNKYSATYRADLAKLNSDIVVLQQKNQLDQKKIIDSGEEQMRRSVEEGEMRMADTIANAAAKSIVEQKNMASAMKQIGQQMLENFIKNALEMKLPAAKSSAAKQYEAYAGSPQPIPTVMAGLAFAEVMAFETGGTIPGAGAVPIIGHGGETVVTKALTDRVNASEGKGGNRGGDTHVHIHASAMDVEGMDRVLSKHSSLINKHVRSAMRKANH
jgi:hypothetical protein